MFYFIAAHHEHKLPPLLLGPVSVPDGCCDAKAESLAHTSGRTDVHVHTRLSDALEDFKYLASMQDEATRQVFEMLDKCGL